MAHRLQLLVPLALLVACGSQHTNPQLLRLAGGGTAKDAAVAPATSGSAVSSDYRLTGTLPSGTPDDAAAWTLAKGRADVTDLEAALHTNHLETSTTAGQPWSWSSCGGADTAVSSDGAVSGSGCAVGSVGSGSAPTTAGPGAVAPDAPTVPSPGGPVPPTYSPPPTPPDVPAATVRRAVAPVFEALGIRLDDVTIEMGPYGGSGSFDPQVGGLEVVGLTTRVDVDQKGAISSANGWLGDPAKADRYPLISAQKAFDTLPAALHPDLCRVGPDGKGCVAPPPQEITGAHLGLLAQPLQEDGSILLPAWLFEVKGATQPLAQIAVQGKYLGEPTPAPAPPTQTDPVAPATMPLRIDAAFRGASANEVVVQYGDDGCPDTGVTHDVKEDATAVYVVLTADADLKPCIQPYRPVKVTIELQAPLGDRRVVDANGGKAVPVSP